MPPIFSLRDFAIGIVFFSLYFVLIYFSLNLSPINTRGEGREAQVVLAMERSGDVLFPLRNGTTIPSKPPLFHWTSNFSSKFLGGVNETTIRLPSLIFGSILVMGFYFFTRFNSTRVFSIIATLIMLSCVEFMRYSTQARVDMVFASALSFSLFFIYSFTIKNNFKFIFYALSIVCLSCSILSKGPFGLILPALIIIIFMLIDRRKYDLRLVAQTFSIFLIAGVIASSWYYFAYLEFGQDFIDLQLRKENLSRILKSDSDLDNLGHGKPIYYSMIYFLQVVLPWCVFFPRIIFSIDKNRVRESLIYNTCFQFFTVWAGVFLIAVIFSVSKRSVYYLPALPAIAYLLAYFFQISIEKELPAWVIQLEKFLLLSLTALIAVIFSATLLGLFINLLSPEILENWSIQYRLESIFTNPFFSLASLAALCLVLKSLREYFYGRYEDFLINFAVLTFLVFLCVQYFVAPQILKYYSPTSFAKKINEIYFDQKLFQFEDEFYAPVYYLDFNAPMVLKEEFNRTEHGESLFLVKDSDYKNFQQLAPDCEILETSDNSIASRKRKLLLVRSN